MVTVLSIIAGVFYWIVMGIVVFIISIPVILIGLFIGMEPVNNMYLWHERTKCEIMYVEKCPMDKESK